MARPVNDLGSRRREDVQLVGRLFYCPRADRHQQIAILAVARGRDSDVIYHVTTWLAIGGLISLKLYY